MLFRSSGGVGVVLYHEEDEAMALSFKLEFPCSNNTAEYEAYLTGIATTLKMGVKHLKVLEDSNLVVCQAKGSFSLKEPSLAPYREMAQRMEEKFSTFEIEHAPRNENRFADALAALGSQIIFEGSSTNIEVSKRKESIIKVLKEKFQEEQGEGDWRIEDIERLCFGKRRVVPQDARWDFIPMRGPRGSPKKIKGNTRQDLWVLWGSQSLPQTPESRLLLAKHG